MDNFSSTGKTKRGLTRSDYQCAIFGIPLYGKEGFSVFENIPLYDNDVLQLPRGIEIRSGAVICRAYRIRHSGEQKICLFEYHCAGTTAEGRIAYYGYVLELSLQHFEYGPLMEIIPRIITTLDELHQKACAYLELRSELSVVSSPEIPQELLNIEKHDLENWRKNDYGDIAPGQCWVRFCYKKQPLTEIAEIRSMFVSKAFLWNQEELWSSNSSEITNAVKDRGEIPVQTIDIQKTNLSLKASKKHDTPMKIERSHQKWGIVFEKIQRFLDFFTIKQSNLKLRKNFHYIFTFGMPEVGKTTLLASLCEYFQNSDKFVLRKDIETKNKKGLKILLDDWLNSLDQKRFLPQTRQWELVEISIGIQQVKEQKILNVSLLDISGEDLRNTFDPFKTLDVKERKMTKGIIKILEQSDLLLLIVPCGESEHVQNTMLHYDRFIELFLQRYMNDIIELDIPVLLVLSKVDLITKRKELPMNSSNSAVSQEQVEAFIKAHYPKTRAIIKPFSTKAILPFSIGEVDTQTEPYKLLSVDLKYAGEIAKWIYKTLRNRND